MEGVRTGAVNSDHVPAATSSRTRRGSSATCARSSRRSEGTFLIGPMAKLGWGTPTLVSLSLGVIIEIPGNIAILGVLQVALPTEDAALIVLQVNFVGAIEFDKQARLLLRRAVRVARAVHHASRARWALLVAFGDDAELRASASAASTRASARRRCRSRAPRRIALNILNAAVARVRVEGYFAVTTNTVQFGARAELFFGFDALSVEGHLGFDALFQFSPFYFIVDDLGVVLGEGLRRRRCSASASAVRARGPDAVARAAARARSRCCSSTSTSTSTSPGARARDTTLPPIAVLPLLAAELEQGRELARAAAGRGATCSCRCASSMPARGALVLHPVGTLRDQPARRAARPHARQGRQPEADATSKRFTLSVAGRRARRSAATSHEPFAPAQFQDIDDADEAVAPGVRAARRRHRAVGGRRRSCAPARWSSASSATSRSSSTRNYRRAVRRFRTFRGALFDALPRRRARSRASPLSQRAQAQARSRSTTRSTVADERVRRRAPAPTTRPSPTRRRSPARRARASTCAAQVAADPALAGTLHVIPAFERGAHEPAARHLLVPALAAPGARQPDHRRRPRRRRAARARRSHVELAARRRAGRRRRPLTRAGRRATSRCTARATSSASTARAIVRTEPRDWITNFEPNYLAVRRVLRRGLPVALHAGGAGRDAGAAAAVDRAGRARRRSEFERGHERRRTGRCRSSTVADARRASRRPTSCGPGRTCTSTAASRPSDAEFVSTDMAAVLPRLAGGARTRTPTSPTRASSARAGSSRTRAYHAFLVPTFETGRLAGLGLDPARRAARDALGLGAVRRPAGARRASRTTTAGTSAPARVGDFEYLVRLLEPQPVDPRVGTRDMDVQRPGRRTCPASPTRTLGGMLRLGGALRVPRASLERGRARRGRRATRTGTSRTRTRSRRALAAFVNLADDYAAAAAPTRTPRAGSAPTSRTTRIR